MEDTRESTRQELAIEPVSREAEIIRVSAEEYALTQRAEQSMLATLQGMDNAAAIFAKRAELVETCYSAALKRTRPEDWVLFRDKQGNEVAMLTASGADLVAELYGIVIQNVRPLGNRGEFAPEKLTRGESGVYGYRAWFDAFSRFNGRSIAAQECTRWSDEDFTGRGVNAKGAFAFGKDATTALDSDLRAAVQRLMLTKAVRILCGMTRVPIADLARAWDGTTKQVAACRKGSGYGTSAERTAAAVTSSEAATKKQTLRAEVLATVGGDAEEARKLLLEITKGKNFAGFDSVDRMSQEWQIDNAIKALHAHPRYKPQPLSDTNGGAL